MASNMFRYNSYERERVVYDRKTVTKKRDVPRLDVGILIELGGRFKEIGGRDEAVGGGNQKVGSATEQRVNALQ